MVQGELQLASSLKIDPLVIVFCDNSLNRIELKQARRKYPSWGTLIAPTDIPLLARSMGCEGEAVDSVAGLERVLAAKRPADRPPGAAAARAGLLSALTPGRTTAFAPVDAATDAEPRPAPRRRPRLTELILAAALAATDLPPNKLMIGYKGVKFNKEGQNVLAYSLIIQLQGKRYVPVWPPDQAIAKLELPFKGWT